MTWDAGTDDARFRADMVEGHRWTVFVAGYLTSLGLPVRVPPLSVRPSFESRRVFRDDGDLFVGPLRVEIRSLGLVFRTPSDYPWRTIHVDLAKTMGSKQDAAVFLFVSTKTKAMVGLLAPDLKRLALKSDVWNVRRGVARDWLVADRTKLVDFPAMVAYLHDQLEQRGAAR